MSTTTSQPTSFLNRLAQILYGLFLLIVAPVYLYMNLPVLNMWFLSLPVGIFFIALTVMIIELRVINKKKTFLFKLSTLTALLTITYIMVISLATWEGFRAMSYQGLIGEIKLSENFAEEVPPVELDKIRIIDQEVAHRLGDKVLGEELPGQERTLGSQAYVGEFRIQNVNGELFWIAPLLHSGFFKWFNNREGTPAYIKVAATSDPEVELVSNVKIKYQPEAYFGSNLHRHLYLSGYMTTGLTDYTFEIDDEGTPYWVVTLYSHEVGFSGMNAYGVAVVNAETGEIKEYTPETAPKWIDRIQPMEMVEEQLEYWGEYIHGYWNFSNLDKKTTTKGLSLVYGKDDQSYWYTGLTSVGQEEGTIGFVLVNTRTKEATRYKQVGATEEAARRSAMGKVQEKKYIGSFPILYNINNVPTYVLSLKDQAGLIKMVAMVSVRDHSIVGVGETLEEALRSYRGGKVVDKKEGIYTIYGHVQRIQSSLIDGKTYYHFTLDNVPNKIFLGESIVSTEFPLTAISDSVMVAYDDARQATVPVAKFDNLELNTTVTTSPELGK
ncbi:hypothetical protein [Aureispira sp. CCB-E]|uniref:hypothetical protein n=1 Tax=Aureispira sp. CCB-E TaxID=3051121 RepID=UPI0028695A90|nr:hypothetical protein [Aureispira sp. CCB-E]WMX15189.1 hypothetical protein QP953_02245 [Aureispira sp. CCB-E]